MTQGDRHELVISAAVELRSRLPIPAFVSVKLDDPGTQWETRVFGKAQEWHLPAATEESASDCLDNVGGSHGLDNNVMLPLCIVLIMMMLLFNAEVMIEDASLSVLIPGLCIPTFPYIPHPHVKVEIVLFCFLKFSHFSPPFIYNPPPPRPLSRTRRLATLLCPREPRVPLSFLWFRRLVRLLPIYMALPPSPISQWGDMLFVCERKLRYKLPLRQMIRWIKHSNIINIASNLLHHVGVFRQIQLGFLTSSSSNIFYFERVLCLC